MCHQFNELEVYTGNEMKEKCGCPLEEAKKQLIEPTITTLSNNNENLQVKFKYYFNYKP